MFIFDFSKIIYRYLLSDACFSSCPATTGHLPHSLKTSIPSVGLDVVRLLSYLVQYPSECCPFIKTFSYICRVIRFWPLDINIVKVFFASPLLKMWKFSWSKGLNGQHSFLYRYMWIDAFCA